MAFRIWSSLLPLLAAFGATALMAWRPGVRGIAAAGIFLGSLVSMTLVLSLIAGAAVSTLLYVTLFTLAFTVLALGVQHVFPDSLMGQVASGLVVVAMTSSIFIFGRTIEPGLELASIQWRIELAVTLSPYAVVTTSIFDEDVLRLRLLYSEMADYPVVYPKWGIVALAHLLMGGGLAGLGALIRRLRNV